MVQKRKLPTYEWVNNNLYMCWIDRFSFDQDSEIWLIDLMSMEHEIKNKRIL
jgi:hypothetical protein